MPPRGHKSIIKGKSKEAPPEQASLPGPELEKQYAVNATHYAKVQEAITIIETTPGMTGVHTALTLDDGASMAPLDEKQMAEKLRLAASTSAGRRCSSPNHCPMHRQASRSTPLRWRRT